MIDAGMSTCPVCEKVWLVTPIADCMLPICGCYGEDTSKNNLNRTCEKCGYEHAMTCPKMEDVK